MSCVACLRSPAAAYAIKEYSTTTEILEEVVCNWCVTREPERGWRGALRLLGCSLVG